MLVPSWSKNSGQMTKNSSHHCFYRISSALSCILPYGSSLATQIETSSPSKDTKLPRYEKLSTISITPSLIITGCRSSADWELPILVPLVLLALTVMLHSDAVLMKWLVASTKEAWLGASIAASSASYSSVILTLSSFDFAVRPPTSYLPIRYLTTSLTSKQFFLQWNINALMYV